MSRCILSEEEFDKLAEQTQRQYWYCENCGKYILKSWSKKCLCGEG
jgi:hypothetical protein